MTFNAYSKTSILRSCFRWACACLLIAVLYRFSLILLATRVVREIPRTLVNLRSNVIAENGNYSSYLCDNRNVDRLIPSTTTPSNQSFDDYRRKVLDPYCDILPIPRNNWTKPKRYVESDIAFVIFTGAPFYQNRAAAQHDTWISRITNYYYLSATPYPYLPVTVIENAGENRLSNMKKLFYGLDRIYRAQMQLPIERRQKWFYIIGCDTFVLPHHLLKRLDNYDYQKPYLVGGHWARHPCLGQSASLGVIDYPSGGAGFLFSLKLLEIMQPHLIHYVEKDWPTTSDISDVALTCLVKKLNISLTKEVGFWDLSPRWTFNNIGREKFHADSEPNDFHYIQPDEMHALDEFYIHQHMDRLANDKNWKELSEFIRRFVIGHYSVLRKKKAACTLPKIVGMSNITNG